MKKYPSILFSLIIFTIIFVPSFFVLAATPTINLSLYSEAQNSQTGKWSWVFKIDTTNIANLTGINVDIYKNGVKDTATTPILITNNLGAYYTGSVLDSNTTYKVVATYQTATNTFEKSTTTGIVPNIVNNTTPVTQVTQPPVPVTPQKVTTTPSNVYNLLAPIGTFKVAPDNIGDYFNTIFLIAIGLCGALAVIMIVIGGIQYMGDESIFGKTEAKSRIKSAILGLLIALGSYALLNTINPALLGGNINIKQVSAEIDAETETAPWTGTSTITGTTANCPEGYVNVATYGNPSTINVCKSIEENLKKLLAAAKSNNPSIILSGSGSRTYDEQVALRRQNSCPDIYNSPSNKCSPETARPGHSKHESGKAIDFSCNGKTMTASGGRNSVCFLWLKANTAPNFKNLASESWHWSDDGH